MKGSIEGYLDNADYFTQSISHSPHLFHHARFGTEVPRASVTQTPKPLLRYGLVCPHGSAANAGDMFSCRSGNVEVGYTPRRRTIHNGPRRQTNTILPGAITARMQCGKYQQQV